MASALCCTPRLAFGSQRRAAQPKRISLHKQVLPVPRSTPAHGSEDPAPEASSVDSSVDMLLQGFSEHPSAMEVPLPAMYHPSIDEGECFYDSDFESPCLIREADAYVHARLPARPCHSYDPHGRIFRKYEKEIQEHERDLHKRWSLEDY